MSKGLFSSMKNFFRGKADDLAKKMADPVRDGKLAIKDSEDQIQKFTTQIARVMAETKRLEKDSAAAEKDIAKWLNIAQNAAASGDEDGARQALERKNTSQQKLDTFKAEFEKSQQLVNRLRQDLNRAKAKVSKAKNNITRLEARSSAANIRKEFAKAQSDFNNNSSGLSALDDLEKAVESDECEAEAYEDLVSDEMSASGSSLEEKYGAPTSEVDDELAALMKGSKKK
ncbi:MAG: PspA/IM30 family protein [Lentisphaeraceae bacterium]|nr:PspA/IM30 family protein [Lentisphaeraceae bacterium]